MNADPKEQLSKVLVTLMKGVTHQETDPALWQSLLSLQPRVRDYVAVLGLELILDEPEGYAYLRQRPTADGDVSLPRLVAHRPLSYPVSLVLVLLRKRMAEFDAKSGDARFIVSREDIVEMVRVFMRDTANEARLLSRIDGYIQKITELGFLRPLKDEEFEVRRILKAFVDAQWLQEFELRLLRYRENGSTSSGEDTP